MALGTDKIFPRLKPIHSFVFDMRKIGFLCSKQR